MFKIRRAEFEDMHFFTKMAQQEGWNPSYADEKAFFAADNNGFFLGELDGRSIGCISAVKYETFGFIGFYVVDKAFRASGYGMKLWNKAMEYLKGENVALDGVEAQVENYKKSGFKFFHKNSRFEGFFPCVANVDKNVVPAVDVDFEALLTYDAEHFGCPREAFLKHWITPQESVSACYYSDKIDGFAVCRKVLDGYKIGPLFAKNQKVAHSILDFFAFNLSGEKFFLDVNEEFKPALELVQAMGMKKVFSTARMYTKGEVEAKWGEVFGITTFELG